MPGISLASPRADYLAARLQDQLDAIADIVAPPDDASTADDDANDDDDDDHDLDGAA